MMNLTLRPHDNQVVLLQDGQFLALIHWQPAKEDAIALKRAAVAAEERVIFVLRSSPPLALELEVEGAFRLGRALHGVAARAEEMQPAVTQRLIREGALLARMGAPVGLSDNSQIQAAQWTEAQWGAEPRRAVPHVEGPRVKATLGTPTILVSAPKGLQ
jgi:hypothetical protein